MSNIEIDSEPDLESGQESENEPQNIELTSTTGTDPLGTSDIEKGKAIQNQLRFWDSMLEVRIRLQKLLVEANKLPQNDTFRQILTLSKDIPLSQTQNSLTDLLNELLELDDLMATGNDNERGNMENEEIPSDEEEIPSDDETINGKKGSNDDDDEGGEESIDGHDDDDEETPAPPPTKSTSTKKRKLTIDDYEGEIKKRVESYKPIRDSIIQKWNDKTQVSTGKLANSKQKNYGAFQISTLKQISQILMDKSRLIGRTQVKRSEYEIIGKSNKDSTMTEVDENIVNISSNEPEVDPEIFDDDDFYHQLLRELIERKASNLTNPIELSRHWLELQKLRSKTKKKVDTKASKARKIRYEVYSKLVNFMAPMDQNPMTDHGVQELFSSLFGNQKDEN